MTIKPQAKIALLTTGDEIVNGEILNTNGQNIANVLFEQNYIIGYHLTCTDAETEIETAINFLLMHHNVLIITGGLGPTSDDRTRYALANSLQRKLIFDETSWEAIVARLARFNLIASENNRQQAEFPENAVILPNPNGTAAGCAIYTDQKFICMLPGPPHECLPMFRELVLPALQQQFHQSETTHKKWRLFGVPEGNIAEELEKLITGYACQTGYRVDFPYLEFKLAIFDPQQNLALTEKVEKFLAPHIICTTEHTASQLLIKALEQSSFLLNIYDAVTYGLLESVLTTPLTRAHLNFRCGEPSNFNHPQHFHFVFSGLSEFWESIADAKSTTLNLTFNYLENETEQKFSMPLRQRGTLNYVVEFLSYKILQLMKDRMGLH